MPSREGCRYSLVRRRSGDRVWFGIYDREHDHEWLVSEDRAEALAEIRRVLDADYVELAFYKKLEMAA